MSDTGDQYLRRRRDRAIAIILRHKERLMDPHVTTEEAAEFRQLVIDQIDIIYKAAARVVDDRMNELYLERASMVYDDLAERSG